MSIPISRRACPLSKVFAVTSILAVLLGADEEWGGAFTLVPVSATNLVLEGAGSTPDGRKLDSACAEGARVSLGLPARAPHQQWEFSHVGDGYYAIRPVGNPQLVLAAAGGGLENGTALVLEKDAGKPWQQWQIKKHVDRSFALSCRHAPEKGMDDFGGGNKPGAKIDLWQYGPGDGHLQWLIKPLPGARAPTWLGDGSLLDIPKGTVKEFAFSNSAIFPGTRRQGWVFIPAQYDGKTPACVYVRQDGYNAAEKGVLEALIAAKEMPVTIGVFVRPGEVPAPMKGTLGRRNRCFEYDAVGDAFARFLHEEILPFVAKTFDLRLSDGGNDRCIAGGSSGGVAAFNAAWQRPDLFTRVYANSGSFVAFRGGHEFPTLVRKFEAKPVRAYLTTGTNDMKNAAGDWYLLDQEMDKALGFSGYEYEFHSINGGHVAGWMDHFTPAMRFLWKDWPQAVKAGPSAPRARDILLSNENWELLAKGLGDARSPACNSKGEVYFIDRTANRVDRIGLDGRIETFLPDAQSADSLCIGAKDELYLASLRTGKLLGLEGKAAKPLADGIPARQVLALPGGGLFLSAPAEKGGEDEGIVFFKDGKKARVAGGLKRATGLALRPDQWILVAADGASKWNHSFQVNDDGSLSNHERYFHLHVADWDDDAGAESLCFALEGQLFSATRSGIQVSADDGPTQVILPVPDRSRVLGVCLSGPGMDTLYAFCGDKIWKRKVRGHACGAFTPWTAVKGSPL